MWFASNIFVTKRGDFTQIECRRCLFSRIVEVNQDKQPHWCEGMYDAKAAELVLYGRALGLSHSEAEDVLQDTFLKLLERPQPPKCPERYCIRTFRNRALNYRRSLWRRLTRELESHRWFEESPEETQKERAAMRQLASLPTQQREVIVLKIWHRYTFWEIAELSGESQNTIAGRYRYGLKKLRDGLENSNEQDEFLGTPSAFMETTATCS